MVNFVISYSKAFMQKFGHLLGLARDETTSEAKGFWRLKDTDNFYTSITEFLSKQISWCNMNKTKLKDFLPLRAKEIIRIYQVKLFNKKKLIERFKYT